MLFLLVNNLAKAFQKCVVARECFNLGVFFLADPSLHIFFFGMAENGIESVRKKCHSHNHKALMATENSLIRNMFSIYLVQIYSNEIVSRYLFDIYFILIFTYIPFHVCRDINQK